MIWGMENKDVRSRTGSTRRAFLSASAVTAVAAPLLSGTALAETDPALSRQAPDPGLRAMLRDIDPDRIKATVLKLVSFQFGLRAIDQAGHRSPAAFPQVAA